jgi:hypothetical protein
MTTIPLTKRGAEALKAELHRLKTLSVMPSSRRSPKRVPRAT